VSTADLVKHARHSFLLPTAYRMAAPGMLQRRMTRELVHARLNRPSKTSAYVGGYGDPKSPQIRKYIEN
jgi:hypothetical protein